MEIDALKQAVHSDKLLCDILDGGDGFAHELPGVLAPEWVGFDGDGGRFAVHDFTLYSNVFLQLGHSRSMVLIRLGSGFK